MKLSHFRFELPDELIAFHPAEGRDESRLMVVHRQSGQIEDRLFRDVLDYFEKDDVLIFNDTKVFPARLSGYKDKTGTSVEVFLLRELNTTSRLWDTLVEPARKIRIGNKLFFGKDSTLVAEVIDNTTSRGRTLRFLYDGSHDKFKKALHALGKPPLPEYIKRAAKGDDAERYQTIYAKVEGAVVAPAAGLHFSRALMIRLELKGCRFAFLTVHCGLGNYRPIDVEDLSKYKNDSEPMHITPETVGIINKGKEGKHRICAVGTSVLRAIETTIDTNGYIQPYDGWTSKFIFPPYECSAATSLITNFHLPLSTFLMATASFGGYDLIMRAYRQAIRKRYRFGAYGDAMLILP